MTSDAGADARPSPAPRLLAHLGLEAEPPSLDYLNRIVERHQRRVPFETLTKLIDYEAGVARGDFLPPLALYVERIASRGAGGLCWTLARGLHALLVKLGFDAAPMVADPGHCCLRVELAEGPFYADVGYAAPIYRAYPLFESFTLATHRERFEYRADESGIQIVRSPGPTKALDPTPRRFDELRANITAANDWRAPHSFLHFLAYSREVDGVWCSLRNGVLTRWLSAEPVKTEVADTDAAAVFADVFGADPALYREAVEVQRRYLPPAS